jgi:hypothetical protein
LAPAQWLHQHGFELSEADDAEISVSFKRLANSTARVQVLDLSDNHLLAADRSIADRARLEITAADCVVVGCEEFANVVRRLTQRVEVIPDCIDPLSEGIAGHRDGNVEPYVLWYGNWGSKHHAEGGLRDLCLAAEWLRSRTLVVLSNSPKRIDLGLPCDLHYVEWSIRTQQMALAEAEAVIVPVKSTPYTRCKSHNRVTTAINAGVPVLASALPNYREFGCTTDSWSRDEQPKVVDRDRLEPYRIEVIGAKWKALLEDLAG